MTPLSRPYDPSPGAIAGADVRHEPPLAEPHSRSSADRARRSRGTRPARYLSRRLALPALPQAGLTVSLGLGAVALVTLLIGHLGMLTQVPPLVLALAGGALLLTDARAAAELRSASTAVIPDGDVNLLPDDAWT